MKQGGNQVLISPKHFTEYSAEEYREYVRSLYIEPERKKAARDFSFRINDKGTFVFTVRNRKPKYLTPEELDLIAEENNLSKREVWLRAAEKKNFTIKRD